MTTNTQFLFILHVEGAYPEHLDPKIKWKLMLGNLLYEHSKLRIFEFFWLELRMKLTINQGANWFNSCGHWSPYLKLK